MEQRLIWLVTLAYVSLAAPARADDWDDCRSELPERQTAAACTAVIEKGGRSNPVGSASPARHLVCPPRRHARSGDD
jgi:hypothetical protein